MGKKAKLIRTYGEDNSFEEYEGDPEELRKLVNASRRKKFMIRCGFTMPTTEGRGYTDLSESVTVTQAEALAFIGKAARFRQLKAERDPTTSEEDLPKLTWTVCDSIIFIN